MSARRFEHEAIASVLLERSIALDPASANAFAGGLRREPWLLGNACVGCQVDRIATATLNDRGTFIIALLDLDPGAGRSRRTP